MEGLVSFFIHTSDSPYLDMDMNLEVPYTLSPISHYARESTSGTALARTMRRNTDPSSNPQEAEICVSAHNHAACR